MGRWQTGRTPAGGADWIVLQVITEGHDALLAIARAAKVEVSAARAAIERLASAGKVTKLGGNKNRRYCRRRA